MRASSLMLLVVLASSAGASAGGCVYEFPRALEDAELKGTVLRASGAPAATAFAAIPGTERIGAADAKGALSLKGLPAMRSAMRVWVDDDGDGAAEEAAYVPFLTRRAAVNKNVTDGIFTSAKEVVTGMLLGEIALSATESVSGTVLEEGAPPAAGRVARVLVFRVAKTGALDNVEDATLPVEAATATADGSFEVRGVASGAVRLIALVGVEGGDVDRVGVVRAQAGDVGVIVDATLPAANPDDDTVRAQLALVGATERATLDTLLFFFPGTTAPDAAVLDVGAPAGTHGIDAPRGVFDVQALVGADAAGLAYGLAFVDDELPPYAPIEIPAERDACADPSGELERDCDHDGIEGLPPIDTSGANAIYDACVPACGGLVGALLDGARCGDVDCDDDADGVSDVDERACVAPLVGTDADGDDLCEPAADPFFLCAENTIAACLL